MGAFIFVVCAAMIALVVFIQTASFGNLVTKIVSDISQRKLNVGVEVKSISLSVFPPGLEFNQVKVRKKFSEDENFSGEFGQIGIYLSLIELEEKKLSFGEIKISDSVIDYKYRKSEEELTEIDQNLIKKIFKAPDDLPVRLDTLILENTKINANYDVLEARRLKLFRNGKAFVVRFHLSNIRPQENSAFALDEIWGDAEIGQQQIKLYRLKLQHDVHTVILKGMIKDYYRLRKSEVSLNGEAQVYLAFLKNELTLPEMVSFTEGNARLNFDFQLKDMKPSGTLDLYAEKLKASFAHADELRAYFKLTDSRVILDKLSLQNGAEKLSLKTPVSIFNLADHSYLRSPINVDVSSLTLTNALRILGPRLSSLHGELNGQLKFEYRDHDLFFTPSGKFIVNNLALVVGKETKATTILKIKRAVFSETKFSVIKGEFQMTAQVVLPRSRLQVKGHVKKNRAEFNIPNTQINLEDFGNIANLDIKGAGELAVTVSGPLESTQINLTGKTKGFELLGYKLDETEKNITLNLGDDEVVINKMESSIGKTHLSGTGTVNWGNAEIALGISSTDTNANDLSNILHPIFSKLTFLPHDLDFKAKIDLDIFGKYRLDDLKIRSSIDFIDLAAYGETLPIGALNLTLANNLLSFSNFEAEKGKGRIAGFFKIDLKSDRMDLAFDWDNLELSTFNFGKKIGLNIQSFMSGKISGGGPSTDYLLKLNTIAYDTRSQGYRFQDSDINLAIRPKKIQGRLNLLGNIIQSNFDLAFKPASASNFTLKLMAKDLKPFLVATLGQHLQRENISGSLIFETEASFQDDFKEIFFSGFLKELNFNHPEFNVNYSSERPQLSVRHSVVNSWNLRINQSDLQLTTSGEGTLGKSVSLRHEILFNSKIVEILLPQILSAEGFVKNIFRIDGRGSDYNYAFNTSTKKLDLSVDQLPVLITDLHFNMDYARKRLSVAELGARMDSGLVNVKGDIYFEDEHPDVNLKFSLDRAEVPLFGKSSVNVTGEGIILGNSFPYIIGGEIIFNKAQFINELNEFSTRSAGFSQVRFLPQNQESPLGKMFNLNLNLKAENPIRITNSLMDVALIGEVRLLGNPARPRGEGGLTSPANSSRIFFKNNEYQIISANINFNPKKEISNPDFDIRALTLISSYKVYPKAYGDLERFNFDLSSEPTLPRNSILSLIAFGYTNEIQNSLYATDQQSLTQVGVGSFVFDRFKISDILNKQFGLQVNLGTLIEQSQTDSLLSGRSQDSGNLGAGSLGRTRSATRIELKKRLDEALTLSVSSTMGGSIGQRQSMNLNYGLSKNIQVEGVYELRTNEEGQEDIIYNSIGGDIKFRRTFK